MFVFFYLKVKISFCDVVKYFFECKYNKKIPNDKKIKEKK